MVHTTEAAFNYMFKNISLYKKAKCATRICHDKTVLADACWSKTVNISWLLWCGIFPDCYLEMHFPITAVCLFEIIRANSSFRM